MVNYVKGNIFDYLEKNLDYVMLHVCNNKGVMGSGVALQVKQRYPNVYKGYLIDGNNLGDISGNCRLINLTAQNGFAKKGTYGEKCYLDYEALQTCLDKINTKKRIIIPFNMGAYRAGGDWNRVLEMVTKTFKDVTVCTLDG